MARLTGCAASTQCGGEHAGSAVAAARWDGADASRGASPRPERGAGSAGRGAAQRRRLDWLRLHDLRHGCATFLLAAGVKPRAIMEVLGHSEIGVTMNTYTHVLPALRQEAADAIDELFGA